MSQRTEQFGQQVHQILAELLRTNVEFPQDVFVAITEVDVAPDLKKADIFINVFPQNKQGTALEIIRKEASQLRKELAQRHTARTTPHLNFHIDEGELQRDEMDKIFDEISDDLK